MPSSFDVSRSENLERAYICNISISEEAYKALIFVLDFFVDKLDIDVFPRSLDDEMLFCFTRECILL